MTQPRRAVMPSEVRWVGIDAHKDTLSLAVLQGGAPKAIEWKITRNEATVKVLVEASHHCSKPPRVGVVVQRRRAGQPAEVVAIAERADSGGRPSRVGVHEQGELFPKCAS